MPEFGSPFKHGSLSSLLLGIGLVIVMLYFYLTSSVKQPIFLFLIILAMASTTGTYFQYKKLSRQNRRESE